MQTETRRITIPPPLFWLLALSAEAWAEGWWLEGGPVVRGGMTVTVQGPSYVQALGGHAAPGPLALPPGVGSPDQYADRVYADGYVRLDAGTLNPDAVGGPGNTWNWAYDQAPQFSGTAQTLSFHDTGERGYATDYSGSAGFKDEILGGGLQLAVGCRVRESERWRLDVGLAFQGVWGAESKVQTQAYVERTARLHVTDVYNVAATIGPGGTFPPPRTEAGGYTGAYDEPGPVISNLPSIRDTQREDLSTAVNTVEYRVAADVYQFALMPRVRYQVSRACSVHLTPKLGVSFVDVTAERTELFVESPVGGGSTVLGSWADESGESGVRFLAGIAAGADVELGRGFYAGIWGGYEWVVDEVRLQLGPNQVAVNASGFVAGATVGLRF